jgi:hypothetical protein
MMLFPIFDSPKLIDLLSLLRIAMKKAFDSSSELLAVKLVQPATNFFGVDLSLSDVDTICKLKSF